MIVFAATLAAFIAASSESEQCSRSGERCRSAARGKPIGGSSSGPIISFAPSAGTGISAVCACTNVTDSRGNALTVFRSSPAVCNKKGLATTGIEAADLIACSNNLPRIEPHNDGVLGIRVEGTALNRLTRFIEICDTNWANVATPALTGQTVDGTACATTTAQVSPFTGTFANAAVLMDDNNASAYEGRSQSVTVTSGVANTMSCWVKGGTLTAARISLDGTAQNITGLSTTTWSLVTVTDASSSGTSISAQVLAGSVVGDTGTVLWGGCQVESGEVVTSMVATGSGTATRNPDITMEIGGVSIASLASAGCVSAYVSRPANANTFGAAVGFSDSNGRPIYFNARTSQQAWDGANEPSIAQAAPAGTVKWYRVRWFGSTFGLSNSDTSEVTSTFDGTMGVTGPVTIGFIAGYNLNGIISRVVVDSNSNGCLP